MFVTKLKPLNFLRPYLYFNYNVNNYSYLLFTKRGTRCLNIKSTPSVAESTQGTGNNTPAVEISDGLGAKKDRLMELKSGNALHWPRIERHPQTYPISIFREKWRGLIAGQADDKSGSVCVRGKLIASRIMGARLLFMDIQQDGKTLQILANLATLSESSAVSEESFQRLYHLAQKGDYISVTGHAHKTLRGELSIVADTLPKIIAPTLRTLPKTLVDRSTRMRNRHVDMIINRNLQHTIRMRGHVIQYLRSYLLGDDFLEVQTPILADKASGAIAKPFITTSEVISDRKIALRIAPELWLKRLMIGGFDRVFEIGPVFRNEGFDNTHNPEFTTCEFYKAYTSLEELIEMTEKLFSGVSRSAHNLQRKILNALPVIDSSLFTLPFRRIEFIPTIETELGEKLPDLAGDTAEEELVALFLRRKIPITEPPTLPRLLDKLSSLYIEPWCTVPSFVMYHPACMAPLAKSFLDPKCNQIVSARAEFFVNCRELANMYEEENDPIEQRKKFEEQARYRDFENDGSVDESYLSAMEWGLPPTGGWGCGVDRLVMLLTSAGRIHDVLSFGGLKNVVNLGSNIKPESNSGKITEGDGNS